MSGIYLTSSGWAKWSVAVLATAFIMFGSAGSAYAQSTDSGGSVTIVAVIAPVRYILLSNSGQIQEILSNTHQDINPIVYRGSLTSQPIPLSATVLKQYDYILTNYKPLHNYGVIYDYQYACSTNQSSFSRTRHLASLISSLADGSRIYHY